MSILIDCDLKRTSVRRRVLQRVVLALLTHLGLAGEGVSIRFVGDTRMRRLNRAYRGRHRTTDVLAFAYREARPGPWQILGDVVISMPEARRQAGASNHSLDEVVLRLLIHGILHVAGYDHERGERLARLMRRKEAELLAALAPLPRVVVEAEGRRS